MSEKFSVVSAVSAGNSLTEWVEIKVQIVRGFDFDSKSDVSRLLKKMRLASDLILRDPVDTEET